MATSRGARGWRRAAGGAFVVAAFLFLALFVVRNLAELRAHEWSVRPWILLLSLVVHIAALFWGVGVWNVLLRSAGYDVFFAGLARVWFVSGLGRYIPGKIWQFVGAAHIGRSTGLPASITVTSLAVHTFYFLIAALLVSIYLLPAGLGLGGSVLSMVQWIAPALLTAVHPAPVAALFRLARRLTGRELTEWSTSWSDAIGIVLLAAVGWGMTGGALYLFLLSLTPLPLSSLPAVIGMNAASFVVGNAVFIAPAGLGAKEGVLAVMLATYMTGPAAAVLAVAARLWTVAAEVIPALLLMRIRERGGGRGTAKGTPPTLHRDPPPNP